MYNKDGINNINANKIGSNTVQQKDINWSKRILGNEALHYPLPYLTSLPALHL